MIVYFIIGFIAFPIVYKILGRLAEWVWPTPPFKNNRSKEWARKNGYSIPEDDR